MQRKSNSFSESWNHSRKSRRPNFFNSQDFERVDSLNASFDTGKIMSVVIPQHSPDSEFPDLRREETYFEKIKNIGTNLRFNLEVLGENIWPLDSANKERAYLLGKEYEISTNGKENPDHTAQLRRDFSNIIWFSYRKNFPKLNHKLLPLAESFVSDTGWGCMIRVCQMIFAECLKRYHLTRDTRCVDESSQRRSCVKMAQVIDENDMENLNYKIISWFLDSEIDPKISPFSIQTLSVYLQERFKLKPGIWLKPSSVLFVLQEIQQDLGRSLVPNLQMEVYLESTIYVVEALKKVTYIDSSSDNSFDKAFAEEFEVVEDEDTNDSPSTKSKTEEDILQEKDEEKEEQTDQQKEEDDSLESLYMDAREIERLLSHKWRDSLVVFILAKIGLDRPNPHYVPFIKELLSYPESVGMIGGKPGLAYYIVGYTKDKLMYLDPHFVQESVQSKEELPENLHTYFTNSIRHVAFNDIDTSVTFGFFIKDEICFKAFVERFKLSCEKTESFLGIEVNAPQENTTDVESFCNDDDDSRPKDEDGFEMI